MAQHGSGTHPHASHADITNNPPSPGLNLHLASLRSSKPAELASGASFSGNVLCDPSAKIGAGCKVGAGGGRLGPAVGG